MAEFLVVSEEEMLAVGASLACVIAVGDVIALRGGLGAGKTTLTRGLLHALGLQGEAPSPSFAIVQPYAPPEVRIAVAHVDLYRLEAVEDAEELGIEDYLIDGALVIEWPERLGDRLWNDTLIIDITAEGEGARRLTADVPPAWKDKWSLT